MTIPEIASAVRPWAAGEPLVRRVYLFGSRARGDNRPDSDIDLALVCRMEPRVLAQCCGDRFTARGLFWEVYGPVWQAELSGLFPVRVHLEALDRDTTRVVRPAVRRDGIRLV